MLARRPRVKATREVMVDGCRRHSANGDQAGYGHRRHQIEHRHRSEQVGQPPGEHRRAGIAGMIEGFVAAHAPGECPGPGQAQ
ncbi:hypothetical protein WR25_15308 [Diploscapter pachys]|uniref:Uncharacterized protein n=1 Tax=Diploscapter pachys TaxID=2018661 RepID=A0A2A2K9U4_9BILA|nr:hypothetical protein WR25_15308 [Diploscapter pachys]